MGLVTEGSFHKSSTHTGTTGKIYPLRMDLQPRAPDFSFLPPCKGKPWNRSMRGIKALRSACWKPGSQCIGLKLVMTSTRQWKSVEFSSQLPELPSQLETSVKFPPYAWHTLGTDLFYWNRMDFLVVGNYITKFLIIRKFPNTFTHMVIKELGMIFTEFGCPFVLKSDNGPCYSSRDSTTS